MASNLQTQFNRGALVTFLWYALWGMAWWPFVRSADITALVIGVILAAIVLLRHEANWLVVMVAVVVGIVLSLLGVGWPLDALPWLVAGAWLL